MNMFRNLTAKEIECRIQQTKPNGISLLLYKDARCDQNILDETVGAFNWKRSHCRDNANCVVSIWDEAKQQWISKEDTGTESNTEAEKGLASDSFKRACFNWGIGRELYTAPYIWVTADKCDIQNGKCHDKFEVSEIAYDGGEIINLAIINSKTKAIVYRWEKMRPVMFVCDECGEVLKPYMGNDGKEVGVRKHATASLNKFGKQLCINCIRKAQAIQAVEAMGE